MSNFEICCKYCGSVSVGLKIQTFKDNTNHIKALCNDCKNTEYIKQDLSDSQGFVMPFGKYKGYAIRDIAVMDRGYCEWVTRSELNSQIKERFEEYLASI